MTLTEFLLARIDEDESRARAATVGPWRWMGDRAADEASLWGKPAPDDEYGTAVLTASGMHTEGYIYVSEPDAEHIARHDPARVMAECKAKRRLVGRYEKATFDGADEAEIALMIVATIYADHPDYDEAWRP